MTAGLDSTEDPSEDGFVDISRSAENMDRYLVRMAIRDFMTECAPLLRGRCLDFGCGEMPYRRLLLSHSGITSYIGMDLAVKTADRRRPPNLAWDGVTIPLAGSSVDCAVATEVFEHCASPELAMRELSRVLRPGGLLIFTVPFLWPLHEVPHDEYRYTPYSLERHLRCSGFSATDIRPLGGWNASLAQMLGLWVRRAPMSRAKRKWLSLSLYPLYRYLVRTDEKPARFHESCMVTGLCGTATR